MREPIRVEHSGLSVIGVGTIRENRILYESKEFGGILQVTEVATSTSGDSAFRYINVGVAITKKNCDEFLEKLNEAVQILKEVDDA